MKLLNLQQFWINNKKFNRNQLHVYLNYGIISNNMKIREHKKFKKLSYNIHKNYQIFLEITRSISKIYKMYYKKQIFKCRIIL